MKRIKSIQLLFVSALSLMIVISSCKKKSDDTTPAPAPGTLGFHMHTNVDTNEVDSYGDTLVMTGGRQIVVTKAQMYVSGIQLQKTDGSFIDGPSVNLLIEQGSEQYTAGSVTAGNYQTVKFDIGLSSATNAKTPTSADGNLNRTDMWFMSTMAMPNNFVFVDFEGLIDTATVPNASNPLIPFAYRIGTNANLRSKTMPIQNFTVSSNQLAEVHIIIDYAKLFTGVALNDPLNLSVTTSAQNSSWSWITQMANNIPSMFVYE